MLELTDPVCVEPMSELAAIGIGEPSRPNVMVHAGYDVAGVPLVVFVDRFEGLAFHSELGMLDYGWLFG